MCSHDHPRQWMRRMMGMRLHHQWSRIIHKKLINQRAVTMVALRILHHLVRWPSFQSSCFLIHKNSNSFTTNSLINLFFLLNNHRLLLPLLSAGLHSPPLHLSMLAVSTPSKRSASVTGKTCVNSRREESVELAERR